MSLWHRHLWRETSRQFNPPTGFKISTWSVDGYDLARELSHGITVVELTCQACGGVKAVRYVGDSGNRGATT